MTDSKHKWGEQPDMEQNIDISAEADTGGALSVYLGPSGAPIATGDADPDSDARAAGRSTDTAAGLLDAILRLEAIIDAETIALQARQMLDFDDFSQRKNLSLLELVRTSRAAAEVRSDQRVVAALSTLAVKLEKNRAVLQMHYEAVREISLIMARAIRDAESDGTYSVSGSGFKK